MYREVLDDWELLVLLVLQVTQELADQPELQVRRDREETMDLRDKRENRVYKDHLDPLVSCSCTTNYINNNNNNIPFYSFISMHQLAF